jgi:hypothetical protein
MLMTLEELFESDEGGRVPDDFPWLIVRLPEEILSNGGLLLYEGDWCPSGINNIWYRVDPAQPTLRQRRHVHVANKKHIKAPNKQASWNDDLTRHDRHKFNAALGSRRNYQAVAKIALGLPAHAILEFHPPHPTFRQIVLLETLHPEVEVEIYELQTEELPASYLEDLIKLNLPDVTPPSRKK